MNEADEKDKLEKSKSDEEIRFEIEPESRAALNQKLYKEKKKLLSKLLQLDSSYKELMSEFETIKLEETEKKQIDFLLSTIDYDDGQIEMDDGQIEMYLKKINRDSDQLLSSINRQLESQEENQEWIDNFLKKIAS